jgi:hypothetical protein
MGRDTGIAQRLRDAGLRVIECDGWQSRGSSDFNPRGSVDHHTAGAATGNAPSLDICINGRPDLAGPLCNVLQARDNTMYVVAAGRANHAGDGGWRGLSGNSSVYGIERENVGTSAEPWRPDQFEAAAQAHAALVRGKASADMVCRHQEWTTRKIDTHDVNGDDLRARIAFYLGGGAPQPDTPNGKAYTMLIAIDGVALCALMGNVLLTFDDLADYGAAKNASPNVPALVITAETSADARRNIYNELIRQHIVAVGEGDNLPAE